MNGRRVLSAFLTALLVSGLFTLWLSKRLAKAAPHAAEPVRQLVVATKDLQAGETLSPASLTTISWPAAQALPGSFGNPQELAGRVLLLPVFSGEPLLAHHLAAPGTSSGFTTKIPRGMRAISLRTDEAADVAGFVQPGSSVDVLVTYHPENGSGFQSAAVLQNVRVLAIDQRSEPEADAKPNASGTVTLLVTPQDAAKLSQASSLGKLTFILRNSVDEATIAGLAETMPASVPAPAAQRALPAATAPATGTSAPRHTAPTGFTVETIAGSKAMTQTFEGTQP